MKEEDSTDSEGSDQFDTSDELQLTVSQIRWAHDSIKAEDSEIWRWAEMGSTGVVTVVSCEIEFLRIDSLPMDKYGKVRMGGFGCLWFGSLSPKVHFRDGRLLTETLEQLIDGRLKPWQLPKFMVWQRGNFWFAVTGNRRLRLGPDLVYSCAFRSRILASSFFRLVW